MTIRRQYSMPNCTLILEGFSGDTGIEQQQQQQSVMSILVNAECHFLSANQKLVGGRAFFESLVRAVSAYSQEFLSGIIHQQNSQTETDWVKLHKGKGYNAHCLTWESKGEGENEVATVEVELSTVQLFDLVEAVDQFFSDSLTLPQLNLELKPVSRRYRQTDEPLVQRATPAVLGVTGLAAAAIAFSLLPAPKSVTDPNLQPPSQQAPPQSEPR
jgi:hypothetical protein